MLCFVCVSRLGGEHLVNEGLFMNNLTRYVKLSSEEMSDNILQGCFRIKLQRIKIHTIK